MQRHRQILWNGYLRQLFQQRLRVLQEGRVEALAEPLADRGEEAHLTLSFLPFFLTILRG